MAPTASDEADAPLLRLLTLVTQRMSQDLLDRQHVAGFDDSRPAHHAVFAHIPPEGIRLVDLADRAGVTKQAMSELVLDLERLGYLRRTPDPADGRAKLIEFTERGWKIVNSALVAFAAMEQELADRIGPTRLRQLRNTLLDMLEDRD